MDNSLLLGDLSESLDCAIDLLMSMGSRQLDSDSSLALRNDWIAESDDIDAEAHHSVSHITMQD